jgi:hypothetical protein
MHPHVRGLFRMNPLLARTALEDAPRTTTKKMGTKNTARSGGGSAYRTITPVPMARWLAEPAPAGESPAASRRAMKAIDVITIGPKAQVGSLQHRCDHALLPCACRSLANSMISTAFLAPTGR